MLRKLAILGTAVVLMGSAAGGINVALASTDITAPETIISFEHTVKDGYVDVGERGISVGDEFLYLQILFDQTDTSRIGTEDAICTEHLRRWVWCSATFAIDGRGTIVVEGAIQFTESTTSLDLPITGGTGDFADVRGTIHDEFLTETKSRVTMTLIP